MTLLALIGLIALLIVLKKIFETIGNVFEGMSQALSDNIISRTYSGRNVSTKYINNVKEKINTIKGNGTDQEYMDSVRQEIDDLLK